MFLRTVPPYSHQAEITFLYILFTERAQDVPADSTPYSHQAEITFLSILFTERAQDVPADSTPLLTPGWNNISVHSLHRMCTRCSCGQYPLLTPGWNNISVHSLHRTCTRCSCGQYPPTHTRLTFGWLCWSIWPGSTLSSFTVLTRRAAPSLVASKPWLRPEISKWVSWSVC